MRIRILILGFKWLMAHTWKLSPKGVPFYRIIQGEGFHQLTDSIKKLEICQLGL